MASAALVVLSLPELLEQILLNLPQKDILLAQRTSRSFRYTTQGSLRLQRALFLAPDWNLEARAYNAYSTNNRPGRKPENNRLLLRAFPGCYPTVTLVIVNDSSSASHHSAAAAAVGEGGGGQEGVGGGAGGGELTTTGRRGSEHWSWDVCIAFPADKMPNCNPAVQHPQASWRRMFLSQPPCVDLHLVRRWQRSLNPAIQRPKGITMGDFYEEAKKTQELGRAEAATMMAAATVANRNALPRAGLPRRWHESYISSDRDWHFEGNIKCSSVEESPTAADKSLDLSSDYPFARTLRNGAVRAFGDDWDPGRTAAWASASLWPFA